MTLPKIKQIILKEIGEKFISNIKKCAGDSTGTHVNLKIKSTCAGCYATPELLSMIRVIEGKNF